MTYLWGPALDAELEYRRTKLTKIAAASRRRQRHVRVPARVRRAVGLPRPRAA